MNFLSFRHRIRVSLSALVNLHFLLFLFDIISGDFIEFLVLVNLVNPVPDSLLVILAAALNAGGGVGGDDDRSSNLGLLLERGWGTSWRLITLHWTSNSGGRGSVENSPSWQAAALK